LKRLQNEPELAAELKAAEEELAQDFSKGTALRPRTGSTNSKAFRNDSILF
jgi:hypothetical protein